MTLAMPALVLALLGAAPDPTPLSWETHARVREIRAHVKEADAWSVKPQRLEAKTSVRADGSEEMSAALVVDMQRAPCAGAPSCLRVHAVFTWTRADPDFMPQEVEDVWLYSKGDRLVFVFEKSNVRGVGVSNAERRWYFDADGAPLWMIEKRDGIFDDVGVKDTRYAAPTAREGVRALAGSAPPSVCGLLHKVTAAPCRDYGFDAAEPQ